MPATRNRETSTVIYEERRITLNRRAFPDYRSFVLGTLWPKLLDAGHQPICLLNGLIGAGAEDVLLVIGFDTFDAWQAAQPSIAGSDDDAPPRQWIAEESVRLMLASRYRPTGPAQPDERRSVYGARRWWIRPEDWETFNQLSFDGIWPAMDHMDHWVIGQFRDAAITSPLEILNLAGYHDPAHWQATRSPAEHGVPAPIMEKLGTLGRDRENLVLKSHVCLMKAHWPD